jgi:hypothetical protein
VAVQQGQNFKAIISNRNSFASDHVGFRTMAMTSLA